MELVGPKISDTSFGLYLNNKSNKCQKVKSIIASSKNPEHLAPPPKKKFQTPSPSTKFLKGVWLETMPNIDALGELQGSN